MTEEQKLKMKEGREKKKAEKEFKPQGEETSPQPLDVLSSKMDKMVEGLNSVSGALVKLVEMQTKAEKAVDKEISDRLDKGVGTVFTPKLEDETYPESYMPPKFRKVVDTILSPEFGARVIDFPDRTDFQLDIFVPDRFSSVPLDERRNGVKDIRTRIITRALGENGVREWCELIRKNLNRFFQKEGITPPFGPVGSL